MGKNIPQFSKIIYLCLKVFVLSYQSVEERGNQVSAANMKEVIGTEKGNDFNRKTIPFQIAANSSALWNSMFVPNDSTEVTITTTNGYTSGAKRSS